MPSRYLHDQDYSTYGAAGATLAQVTQASALIDHFLQRPEGLVWEPDPDGVPCYMSGANPTLEFATTSPVSPGQNVVVTLDHPLPNQMQLGEAFVIDRGVSGKTESADVVSVNGNQVTFRRLKFAHAAGAKLEAGMFCIEQRPMPKQRPITHLSRSPVLRIVSGAGRYGYSRRGDMASDNMDDFNLLAAFSKFGGPPAWETFDPAVTDFDASTGQFWVPAGVMIAYFTEVKVRYISGFRQSALPGQIKTACGMLVRVLNDNLPAGQLKSYQAGDTKFERFAASAFSNDVTNLLLPYKARIFA